MITKCDHQNGGHQVGLNAVYRSGNNISGEVTAAILKTKKAA
jgi:hypothetical protein